MVRSVVVGTDASRTSEDALLWAADCALARRAELEIVHAFEHSVWGSDRKIDGVVEREARVLLAARARQAEHRRPGLVVRTHLIVANPAEALVHASQRAELAVVGSGPVSRLTGHLVGSRSYQVAAAAHCPVVVVPALPSPQADDVVAGVDGSPASIEVVALAAAEADRLGEELRVVHAWTDPAYLSDGYLLAGFTARVREEERIVLAESVAGTAERYPGLLVDEALVEGPPGDVLLSEARNAKLVVVGSRGRTGIARLLLGSVSHEVVLGARCPVLVARNIEAYARG